jgi:riboflavin synthase
MFTGLVTDVGTIERVSSTEAGREFRVRCGYQDLGPGESIAVNGACMTVREAGPGWFTFAAVVTSLDRTAMGAWEAGRRVNLERALRASDRLGGHFVLGHVDCAADVTAVARRGDALLVDIALPAALATLVVPHGSIAVDGVSLTVNALRDPADVQLSLIDYTLRHTTLGELRRGDVVHVEADVIGKYAQRLASGALTGAAAPGTL